MEIQYLLNQALENENIREIEIVVKILKEFEKITQIKFELLHKELMEKPKKGLKQSKFSII
ncbi:hypothetical protein mru_1530 [Methanobrevibacter ruminantium M1]|uniref:Uncharacterized protein n=1 Tax=Methanobrevibacter ruminantium (strain ATCC 35063 / DSM 1093 / JCM 13430 / OCM 146 / M1) TaxID=634498 RepID=D3E4B9_METRM|nr:hypothetical protein [Methanobrevibacter ruminantium]ADC47380.1 hypothetical protein mru_1530 [Methanobrevibacter ruminantium M1]